MALHETFNRSWLSRFLNSPAGRLFRLIAGAGFVVAGYLGRAETLGLASMVWGGLAMIAGGFEVCFISVVLGGPFSGARIRSLQHG